MTTYIPIALQAVAILLAIYSVGSIIKFRLGMDARYLIMASTCVVVYSTGYLFQMLSSTKEMYFVSLCFEYLGISFLGTLFSLFICEYCSIRVTGRAWRIIGTIDAAFYVIFVSNPIHHLFIRSFKWVEGGIYGHAEGKIGPFFALFYGFQFLLIVNAILMVAQNMKKIRKKSERVKLYVMLCAIICTMVSMIIGRLRIMHNYDPTSLFMSFTISFIAFFLTHYRSVNIVNSAYSSLFKDLDEGVIITDSEGKYLDSNAMANYIFTEMRGWEPGHDINDIDLPLCEFGYHPAFERNQKYYTSIAKPIIEARKQIGYLIVLNDVTELQKQMDEMERLKNEANLANQAKSAFLANMSHEIRTPLNAIIGMTELAQRDASYDAVMDYLSQIKASGKMLLDILCETLDLSKAEAGKLDLCPVEFEPLSIFNSVINVINMRIGEKELSFYIDINPDIPKILYGDDIRLRQVMINFLGNAEKYTSAGSITLRIDFDIISASEIMLTCEVSDTGCGIKEEDIDKLFKPFSRVDMVSNRQIVGTGLGLAISGQLIEMMGGHYEAKSEYGSGSSFSFCIPLKAISTEPMCNNAKREVITVEKSGTFNLYGVKENEEPHEDTDEMPSFPDASVLVVDDNKVNVKVLCAYLKQYQITADFCCCGQDAIDMVDKKDYDLVLLDHMMPEMDGAETASRIRMSEKEHNRSMPIIACTANVMKGADEFFIQNGMTDYISKPIQLNILTRKVKKYLGKMN